MTRLRISFQSGSCVEASAPLGMLDRRAALSMLLALPLTAPALAQSYPARPIRTLLPFAPGGVTDVSARYVAQLMAVSLGQNLIIENRSGGGGAIGATAAARAEPDGYTILVASSATHSILPAMSEKLEYDPIKSFAPISGMSNAPYLLVVNADVPVKNVKELAEYAKANAGTFNFAAATGTPPHILAYVFRALTGTDFPVALYRGGGPAMADLFANQVHAIFQPTTIVIPLLDDKRIRILGIATEERSSLLPDVPTLAEQGFPQIVANSWNGLVAPAGTPAPIVGRLNQAANEALNSPELKARFGGLGITIIAGSTDRFGAFMRDEAIRWDALVKAAKMPKS
ncbi:MAG: tripartite tricarboxylate transporter substrate binding protein [Xanthobacteraceae bacterium]|nr:tripartite tricarboxylate transporter substrate binding protein [Xanthobacteraceae bacterium]